MNHDVLRRIEEQLPLCRSVDEINALFQDLKAYLRDYLTEMRSEVDKVASKT